MTGARLIRVDVNIVKHMLAESMDNGETPVNSAGPIMWFTYDISINIVEDFHFLKRPNWYSGSKS